jgi:hypothetical protein
MSHFAEEDWADFVRQEGAAAQRARMQRHVDDRCPECSRTLQLWTAVGRFARREASYQPPDHTVRQAKGQYSIHRPSGLLERTAAATLLVDSAREPSALGVRVAGGAAARQLLYRSGHRVVKLRLESPPDTERLSLVGQIVDESALTEPVEQVAVLLLRGRSAVTGTLTNRLGEFEMEFDAAKGLRLSLGTPGTRPITVRLPELRAKQEDGGATRGGPGAAPGRKLRLAYRQPGSHRPRN